MSTNPLLVPEEYSPIGFKSCDILPSGKLRSPVRRTIWSEKIMKAHDWRDSSLVLGVAGIHAVRLPKKFCNLPFRPSMIIRPKQSDSAVVVVRPTAGSSVVASKYSFRASEVCIKEIILHPNFDDPTTEKKLRQIFVKQNVIISVASKDCPLALESSGTISIEKSYFGVPQEIVRLADGSAMIVQSTLHEMLGESKFIEVTPGSRVHRSLIGYLFAKPKSPNYLLPLRSIFGEKIHPIRGKINFFTEPTTIARRIKRTSDYSFIEKIRIGEDNLFRNIVIIEVKPMDYTKMTFSAFICGKYEVTRIFAPNRDFETFTNSWNNTGDNVTSKIKLEDFISYWESCGVTVSLLE